MNKNTLFLKSYAKINLYLEIGKKIENGYHEIETIFQTINLFDEIFIEILDEPGFRIHCNHPEVPIGKDSIVYRAVTAIMQEKVIRNQGTGLKISINKRIPLASGLGGGSSNTATILLGISELLHLEMNVSRLMDLAADFGMDVPYFIRRGTVYAGGRGEVLFPLVSIDPPMYLLLVNPGIKISTKWAYGAFDQERENRSYKHVNISPFVQQRKRIQFCEIGNIIYNRFDLTISKYYPVINQIKDELKELGVLYTSLSGSGPTVFGIVENKQKLDEVYFGMKNHYPFICRASTVRAEKIYLDNVKQISNE